MNTHEIGRIQNGGNHSVQETEAANDSSGFTNTTICSRHVNKDVNQDDTLLMNRHIVLSPMQEGSMSASVGSSCEETTNLLYSNPVADNGDENGEDWGKNQHSDISNEDSKDYVDHRIEHHRNDLRILICCANLGNKRPTEQSIAAWLPENGVVPVMVSNTYQGEDVDQQSMQSDIIVIAMQESLFGTTSPIAKKEKHLSKRSSFTDDHLANKSTRTRDSSLVRKDSVRSLENDATTTSTRSNTTFPKYLYNTSTSHLKTRSTSDDWQLVENLQRNSNSKVLSDQQQLSVNPDQFTSISSPLNLGDSTNSKTLIMETKSPNKKHWSSERISSSPNFAERKALQSNSPQNLPNDETVLELGRMKEASIARSRPELLSKSNAANNNLSSRRLIEQKYAFAFHSKDDDMSGHAEKIRKSRRRKKMRKLIKNTFLLRRQATEPNIVAGEGLSEYLKEQKHSMSICTDNQKQPVTVKRRSTNIRKFHRRHRKKKNFDKNQRKNSGTSSGFPISFDIMTHSLSKPMRTLNRNIRSISASMDHTKKKPSKAHARSDSSVLHRLISQRCNSGCGSSGTESYEFPVQYQRGEMRLTILIKKNLMKEVTDIDYRAVNTGYNLGGNLPNKGGIVATVALRKTRFAFVAAHLKAHEGPENYAARCDSMSAIFDNAKMIGKARARKGTKSSKNSSSRTLDVSVSSHFCFVCGDLNFRITGPLQSPDSSDSGAGGAHILPSNRRTHHQKVLDMIDEKNWDALHDADELVRALDERECLTGFQTLPCTFSPTFKVIKGKMGFHYDQRRTPSYTDRILWHSLEGLENSVEPLYYVPCENYCTSDHKPIRGAFAVKTNAGPGDGSLDRSSRRVNFRRNTMNHDSKVTIKGRVQHLSLIFSKIQCTDLTTSWTNNSSNESMSSIHNTQINPYITFMVDPLELAHETRVFRRMKRPSMGSRRRGVRSSPIDCPDEDYCYNSDMNEQQHELQRRHHVNWPFTRTMKKTSNPRWAGNDDTIVFNLPGLSDITDLVGSVLYLSVLDESSNNSKKKIDDSKEKGELIGTVAINLYTLCCGPSSTSSNNKEHPEVDGMEPIIVDAPILRGGRVYGQLSCRIQFLFGYSSGHNHTKTNHHHQNISLNISKHTYNKQTLKERCLDEDGLCNIS